MSEELSPEHYPKPSKERKRKLPTKEEWHEQAKKMLRPKDLTAKELVELHRFLDDSNNPFKTEEERQNARVINALRSEVLRRHGLNPDEWVFYTTTQPQDMKESKNETQLTEDDMKRLHNLLPDDIELFVAQGVTAPSLISYDKREENVFKTIPNHWEVYIREKPAQIHSTSPQIEGPKEQ